MHRKGPRNWQASACTSHTGQWLVPSLFLSILLVSGSSCLSLQAPVETPYFEPGEMFRTSRAGIEMKIVPIEGRTAYWKLFNDDLPELGIAAVWISISNTRLAEVDLTQLKISIRRAQGESKALETSELFSRYYRARNIRMYSIHTDRKARVDMEKVEFKPRRLAPETLCEGFVFFRIDPGLAPQWTGGGVLFADNILLENGERIALESTLSHADP